MNDKTKKFNHVSEASLSIVSRDIAWQLSNSVAWKIGMAAKSQKGLDDELTDRLINDNKLIEESIMDNLRAVVDIIEGAQLDGVSDEELSDHIEEAVQNLAVPNGAILAKIKINNYDKLALSNLALKLGGEAYADLVGDELKAAVKEEIVSIRRQKTVALIEKAHAMREYMDIAMHMTFTLLTPRDGESIKGAGDYTEYVVIREKAFQTRLKNLRGNLCKIDDTFKSRYDDNGNLNSQDAMEMDSAFSILLEEAVLCQIDVSKIDALPTQADIDAKKAALDAA